MLVSYQNITRRHNTEHLDSLTWRWADVPRRRRSVLAGIYVTLQHYTNWATAAQHLEDDS
jgi:hypothetical protein